MTIMRRQNCDYSAVLFQILGHAPLCWFRHAVQRGGTLEGRNKGFFRGCVKLSNGNEHVPIHIRLQTWHTDTATTGLSVCIHFIFTNFHIPKSIQIQTNIFSEPVHDIRHYTRVKNHIVTQR